MRLILTLTTFLISSGNTSADRYCDPAYGPQDDLASLIQVVSREFDTYEVYLPKFYQGKDLSWGVIMSKHLIETHCPPQNIIPLIH